MVGSVANEMGDEIDGPLPIGPARYLEPFLYVGAGRAGDEIFPRQRVFAAVVVSRALQFQPQNFAKKAATTVIARSDHRLMRQLPDEPLQCVRWRRSDRQVDCIGQMRHRKFTGITDVDKYRTLVVDEFM